MELEFILINIFCIWVGCLFTFVIWFIKFTLEKLSLIKIVEQSRLLSEDMDKFEKHIEELKSEVEAIKDTDNMSVKNIRTIDYVIYITPIIKRYKKLLEEKMKKMTYKLEKKSNTLDNTLRTMNMFLGIISFGKLKVIEFENYNGEEF